MMQEADEVVVVVGDGEHRSRRMDGILAQALNASQMSVRQRKTCHHAMELPMACLDMEVIVTEALNTK